MTMKLAQNTVRVLLEVKSPNEAMIATVEEQDGAVYLYLEGSREFETAFKPRACWVRNLVPAPSEQADPATADAPPLLASDACAHPNGAPPLDVDKLRIVFTEQGDGAALFEGDEMLAAFDEWTSTERSTVGFARDALKETPIARPMAEARARRVGPVYYPSVADRIRSAREFWKDWSTEDDRQSPWHLWYDRLKKEYTRAFGVAPEEELGFGSSWPPRMVQVYRTEDEIIFVTLGCSILPQGQGYRYSQDGWYPPKRVEVGFAINLETWSDLWKDQTVSWVAGHGILPWRGWSWLSDLHVFNFHPWPLQPNQFPGTLLREQWYHAPKLDLRTPDGEKIHMQWLVPLTPAERDMGISEDDDRGSQRVADDMDLADEAAWPHHLDRKCLYNPREDDDEGEEDEE